MYWEDYRIMKSINETIDQLERAAALAKTNAQPRDSLRGGAEYRKDMVEVLMKRALEDCLTPFGGMAEG